MIRQRFIRASGRRLDPTKVAEVNRLAVDDCVPDLTLVIDVDPKVGLERAHGRELFDRMENRKWNSTSG